MIKVDVDELEMGERKDWKMSLLHVCSGRQINLPCLLIVGPEKSTLKRRLTRADEDEVQPEITSYLLSFLPLNSETSPRTSMKPIREQRLQWLPPIYTLTFKESLADTIFQTSAQGTSILLFRTMISAASIPCMSVPINCNIARKALGLEICRPIKPARHL